VVTSFGKTLHYFGDWYTCQLLLAHRSIEQERGRPRLNSDIYAIGMIGIFVSMGLNSTHQENSDTGDIIRQTSGARQR